MGISALAVNMSCMDSKDIDWTSIRAAVVGAGQSGMAAAKLLYKLGAGIRIVEKAENNIVDTLTHWARDTGTEIVFGAHNSGQFEDINMVIPSPGIAISSLKPLFPEENMHVLSETELAWRQLTDEKVIGITGTNGKTTTAKLCAAMLEEQGISYFLGGNIGTPLSEYILGDKKCDVVILELSSFQLQTCILFRPDIGILLNINHNHLDYHVNMSEYVSAKLNLCKNQHREDMLVVSQEAEPYIRDKGFCARVVVYKGTECFASKLLGSHNQNNIEAAWLACSALGVTEEHARQAVGNFEVLEHRLEHVRVLHDVTYINDSKGTTVAALDSALGSFNAPILLLAGGVFKGGDLSKLRDIVQERVRAVALFGGSRKIFEDAWGDIVPLTWDETLEEATKRLAALACKGDIVLLCPATSSFDQYINYIERGNAFKHIVREVLV